MTTLTTTEFTTSSYLGTPQAFVRVKGCCSRQVPTHPETEVRSYLRSTVFCAGLVALSLATGACSKDEPTPAEARRNRLETRLEASFSDTQATCILGKLDETTISALDRTATLAPGRALDRYSEAVRACVADPATTTEATSTSGAVTTTSPTTTPDPTTTEPGPSEPGSSSTTSG